MVVEAEPTAAGYLVLTDTFYPGWKAFIDGAPSPILRANYLMRAVPLAAGPHTVTFVYDPLSFRLGAGLSLGALGCVVVYVGARLRRRSRKPGRVDESSMACELSILRE